MKNKFYFIIFLLFIGCTNYRYWPNNRWCTGICQFYEDQIQFIKRNAVDSANKEKMKMAEKEMRKAMKESNWPEADKHLTKLYCASKEDVLSYYVPVLCRGE